MKKYILKKIYKTYYTFFKNFLQQARQFQKERKNQRKRNYSQTQFNCEKLGHRKKTRRVMDLHEARTWANKKIHTTVTKHKFSI